MIPLDAVSLLFKEQLIQKAQAGLDRALRKRPELESELLALAPFRLSLTVPGTPLQTGIMGEINEQKIYVLPPNPELTCTELTVSLSAMLKWATGSSIRTLIQDGDLQVKGDLLKLDQLQNILKNTDIDWAAKADAYLGPAATGVLSHLLQQGKEIGQKSRQHLKDDLEVYLKEELHLIPSPDEASQQFDAISDLRLDVDRIEARIKRLTKSGGNP